jgi:two-component sensor histidine kinase
MPPDLSKSYLEHAPLPMATVEGAMHIVSYVNPAFCRLIGKTRPELVGKPFSEVLPEKGEFVALLDRVYRTGKSESYTQQEHSGPRPSFRSHTMWPVMANEHAVGVMIQVTESAPLYEQRELDSQMLTNEVAHRIKNNLQIVVGLIAHEARRAAAPCVQGYKAMQARIVAIAQLYDLMSQSARGRTVAVDAYLREIAKTMSASLLGETSSIKIEVEAEALEIDPERAVPFGLLVNELATNAIKHAFPDGIGRVVVSVRRIGEELELDVADNGAGMKIHDPAKTSEKHGADFVAIFVRQLGGSFAVLGSEETGTTVRIQFPLLAVR